MKELAEVSIEVAFAVKEDLFHIPELRTEDVHLPGDLSHDRISVALDAKDRVKIFAEEAQSHHSRGPVGSESEHDLPASAAEPKDIARFEIDRLHSHPKFLNFKKMEVPIIQCFFWPDAWKVFCVCVFLNCTRRGQVEKVVWKFFELYPTPQALLAAPDGEVQEVVRTLGFYKRRTTALKRLSEDFLSENWKIPEDLRSVGVYAATCYRMMFEFELGQHAPDDHALVDLWNWMRDEYRYKFGRTLPDVRR